VAHARAGRAALPPSSIVWTAAESGRETGTLAFAKSPRKERFRGNVLAAGMVVVQAITLETRRKPCTSTSLTAETFQRYFAFREDFADISALVLKYAKVEKSGVKIKGKMLNEERV